MSVSDDRLIQVLQRVVVADGHEHAAGTRVQLLEADVGFAHQLELILVLLVRLRVRRSVIRSDTTKIA